MKKEPIEKYLPQEGPSEDDEFKEENHDSQKEVTKHRLQEQTKIECQRKGGNFDGT